MERLVEGELEELVKKHAPDSSLRSALQPQRCLSNLAWLQLLCATDPTLSCYLPPSSSALDDIVLGYVVEVLLDIGKGDSSFDVDQFVDMISAYIPEFASVDRSVSLAEM